MRLWVTCDQIAVVRGTLSANHELINVRNEGYLKRHRAPGLVTGWVWLSSKPFLYAPFQTGRFTCLSVHFPHFSPTCFDILSLNFVYDFLCMKF